MQSSDQKILKSRTKCKKATHYHQPTSRNFIKYKIKPKLREHSACKKNFLFV